MAGSCGGRGLLAFGGVVLSYFAHGDAEGSGLEDVMV